MKRDRLGRINNGIPQVAVSFAAINQRHVHRQAVLTDPGGGVSFGVSIRNLSYDALNRVWSNSHLFRASVTLAGAQ